MVLGHTFIDILKIDIEGGEFDALTSFVTANAEGDLPVGQLQLEIHARNGRERFDSFIKWWASLEAAGLRPFWTEPNMIYINIVRGTAPDLAEVCIFILTLEICKSADFFGSTLLLTSAETTRLSMRHLTKPEVGTSSFHNGTTTFTVDISCLALAIVWTRAPVSVVPCI